MNENITEFLYDYVENPDPQYAVMLKGKWGCGKSFFIHSWLRAYKEKVAGNQCVLEPLYVSLYGLNETSQITQAIDKILHPILHSRGVEFTKKLFKFAGKIAFRTSLDWDKDEKEDVSFESTLDSLSVFATKDESVIKTKLIVFDDLERCLIDMKQLLGYINNFVEHGACHVIIVGDETHTTDEARKTLIEFKEKTVGRELEILPDNLAAIHYFLNDDVPLFEWLKNKERFINEIFTATKCDNLRLVRQCLYDYSVLISSVSDFISDKNESFMQSLLATYLVCYCEYRGENHDLLEDWDLNYFYGLGGDEATKEGISKLQGKYRTLSEKYQFEILDSNNVRQIIREINTGFSNRKYVEDILQNISQGTPRIDKLAGFMNMQSDVFLVECNSLTEDIMSGNIPNMYILGRSLALLAFLDDKKLFVLSRVIITRAKKLIAETYKAQTDKDELYKFRTAFLQGIGSFGIFHNTAKGQDILNYANKIFEESDKRLLNKIETILCDLNDTNVGSLSLLSMDSTPDHHCAYNMTSIFKRIDSKVVYASLKKMTNTGIMEFCHFISRHYMFGCSLGSGCNRYQDDLSFLTDLQGLVSRESKNRKSVDRYVFQKLVKHLDGAIKRANGDNGPVDI